MVQVGNDLSNHLREGNWIAQAELRIHGWAEALETLTKTRTHRPLTERRRGVFELTGDVVGDPLIRRYRPINKALNVTDTEDAVFPIRSLFIIFAVRDELSGRQWLYGARGSCPYRADQRKGDDCYEYLNVLSPIPSKTKRRELRAVTTTTGHGRNDRDELPYPAPALQWGVGDALLFTYLVPVPSTLADFSQQSGILELTDEPEDGSLSQPQLTREIG